MILSKCKYCKSDLTRDYLMPIGVDQCKHVICCHHCGVTWVTVYDKEGQVVATWEGRYTKRWR